MAENNPIASPNKHSVFSLADKIRKRKHDNAETAKMIDDPSYVAKPWVPKK